MTNNTYLQNRKMEMKTELIAKILKEADFLSKKELGSIADQVYDGDFFVESIEDVVLHTNARSFAKAAKMKSTGMVHSWAGEDTLTQSGVWLLGDGHLGFYKEIEYSDNGNLASSPEKETEEPEFSLDQNQAVLVRTVERDSYNGNNYYEESWALHILLGNSPH